MRWVPVFLLFLSGWALGEEPVKFEEVAFPVEENELVRILRRNIIANRDVTEESGMKDYVSTIPKTGVDYEMVAIQGGEFLMGSPPDESGRNEDEGPQHRVRISPFWMGRFEVTWDQFEPFMITNAPRRKDGSPIDVQDVQSFSDAVSSPTTPYTDMSFGMGTKGGFPAVCMTQHAASKFCEWLSAQTGHFYRLPTEAEWEYACRAGTTTAYWSGNDVSELVKIEVIDPEMKRLRYEKVGSGKANPWGLYDMHGNVCEWCLDGYAQDAYHNRVSSSPKGTVFEDPYVVATERYPRVAKGGSWYDDAGRSRSAARSASSPDWQMGDAQLPKSLWYLTDAMWLGFRIVRPLQIPSEDEMFRIWNSGNVH